MPLLGSSNQLEVGMSAPLLPESHLVNLLFAGGTLAVMSYGEQQVPFDDDGYFLGKLRESKLVLPDGEYVFRGTNFGATTLETPVTLDTGQRELLVRVFDRYLLGVIVSVLDEMVISKRGREFIAEQIRDCRAISAQSPPQRDADGLVRLLPLVDLNSEAPDSLVADSADQRNSILRVQLSVGEFLILFHTDGGIYYKFDHFLAPITTPVALQQIREIATRALCSG